MTTESIIDAILSGDMNNAGEQFEQELRSRISDALDAKKVEVGGSMGFTQEFDQPIEENVQNMIKESAKLKQAIKDMDGSDFRDLKDSYYSITDGAYVDIDISSIEDKEIKAEVQKLLAAQQKFKDALRRIDLGKYL
jgi:hypothetical protein